MSGRDGDYSQKVAVGSPSEVVHILLKYLLVIRDVRTAQNVGLEISSVTLPKSNLFSSSWISRRKQVVFKASGPLCRPCGHFSSDW